MSKTLFSPREHKAHIFKPPCNVPFLLSGKQFKNQKKLSRLSIFRSMMLNYVFDNIEQC